jgi:hypothetical protein
MSVKSWQRERREKEGKRREKKEGERRAERAKISEEK